MARKASDISGGDRMRDGMSKGNSLDKVLKSAHAAGAVAAYVRGDVSRQTAQDAVNRARRAN